MAILSSSYAKASHYEAPADTMVLKRKRSDSEISSSSSLLNVTPQFPFNVMSMDYHWQNQIQTRSLFSSRTRKRYRNNRPDESQVHQHTLSLLYSAQRAAQSYPSPPMFEQQDPTAPLPNSNARTRQPSLHSFWQVSNVRQSSPSSSASSSGDVTPTVEMTSPLQATSCEDCDTSREQADDAMDIDMMDIGTAISGKNYLCSRCGK
ncbi:hypothetical protein BJ878DRAFT_320387 [Calycina marina]|uniref:Uncharacterized protein n=1 Tax=Calycina marina TaxID=1763456 RepID=A0A9P7YVE0_9HELO|nr:hypothetical protein BJ878DRAFT_320387 [Calycina marina]